MNRLLVLCTAFLTLAACSGMPTAQYRLDVRNVSDEAKIRQLGEQSVSVIERRLQSMGEEGTASGEVNGSGSMVITAQAEHQEALDALTEQLQAPFDLQIMSEVQGDEKPDVIVEQHGGFVKTGITADDLLWVEGGADLSDTDLGMVKLTFSEEGRAKMAALFARMKGKNIGIFVRGQLVSKLEVETGELKDDIIIRQIPSIELAEIFAHDVNVGIHVTFTPLP